MHIRLLLVLSLIIQCSCSSAPNKEQRAFARKKVGSSAHDIVSAGRYDKLMVEIQYIRGYRIEDTSIARLLSYLTTLCHKPDGIEIDQSVIYPTMPTDTLTIDQVLAIELKHRKYYSSGHTLAIYVLITNGYASTYMIAGRAYNNTSIVVYGKTISVSFFGDNQQLFVLQHEFGHLMGLVNCGTTMQAPHEDSVHKNHCTNKGCVMNYGSGSTVLDSSCLRDLRAIGAK